MVKPISKSESARRGLKEALDNQVIPVKVFNQYKLKNFRSKKKYRNKNKVYNGRSYDSVLEANFAEELDWRLNKGEIKEIIPQYKIELRGVAGQKVCNYFVDFKVINSDDSITYFEVKGVELAVWRLKWKLCQQQMAVDEPASEMVVIK